MVFSILAPLVGHVGDGNFHLCVLFDPNDAEETARAKDLAERVARYNHNVTYRFLLNKLLIFLN